MEKIFIWFLSRRKINVPLYSKMVKENDCWLSKLLLLAELSKFDEERQDILVSVDKLIDYTKRKEMQSNLHSLYNLTLNLCSEEPKQYLNTLKTERNLNQENAQEKIYQSFKNNKNLQSANYAFTQNNQQLNLKNSYINSKMSKQDLNKPDILNLSKKKQILNKMKENKSKSGKNLFKSQNLIMPKSNLEKSQSSQNSLNKQFTIDSMNFKEKPCFNSAFGNFQGYSINNINNMGKNQINSMQMESDKNEQGKLFSNRKMNQNEALMHKNLLNQYQLYEKYKKSKESTNEPKHFGYQPNQLNSQFYNNPNLNHLKDLKDINYLEALKTNLINKQMANMNSNDMNQLSSSNNELAKMQLKSKLGVNSFGMNLNPNYTQKINQNMSQNIDQNIKQNFNKKSINMLNQLYGQNINPNFKINTKPFNKNFNYKNRNLQISDSYGQIICPQPERMSNVMRNGIENPFLKKVPNIVSPGIKNDPMGNINDMNQLNQNYVNKILQMQKYEQHDPYNRQRLSNEINMLNIKNDKKIYQKYIEKIKNNLKNEQMNMDNANLNNINNANIQNYIQEMNIKLNESQNKNFSMNQFNQKFYPNPIYYYQNTKPENLQEYLLKQNLANEAKRKNFNSQMKPNFSNINPANLHLLKANGLNMQNLNSMENLQKMQYINNLQNSIQNPNLNQNTNHNHNSNPIQNQSNVNLANLAQMQHFLNLPPNLKNLQTMQNFRNLQNDYKMNSKQNQNPQFKWNNNNKQKLEEKSKLNLFNSLNTKSSNITHDKTNPISKIIKRNDVKPLDLSVNTRSKSNLSVTSVGSCSTIDINDRNFTKAESQSIVYNKSLTASISDDRLTKSSNNKTFIHNAVPNVLPPLTVMKNFANTAQPDQMINSVWNNNFKNNAICSPRFMSQSLISLNNGQVKPISQLTTQDFVDSTKNDKMIIMNSAKVTNIRESKIGSIEISFEIKTNLNSEIKETLVSIYCTPEHPFFVMNQGWSSVDPEKTFSHYNLTVAKLKLNDTIVSLSHISQVESISQKSENKTIIEIEKSSNSTGIHNINVDSNTHNDGKSGKSQEILHKKILEISNDEKIRNIFKRKYDFVDKSQPLIKRPHISTKPIIPNSSSKSYDNIVTPKRKFLNDYYENEKFKNLKNEEKPSAQITLPISSSN
ncbi:hypothetical protein A3Q56_04644 [Intoshia linei]|uniref:AXH domain-containing protein n=1 Tax=Intoshia linei TaxID=1819745 RepID=A0A177B1J1_9BILA|nr:hypothetical protein A3Q56_04644 [Intoshia linei]